MHEKDSGAGEKGRRHCENCNIKKCIIKLEEGKFKWHLKQAIMVAKKERWKLKHLGECVITECRLLV